MKLIVEKPFRSMGTFYNKGDIITDTSNIRFIRTKIGERKVRMLEGSVKEAVSSFNSPAVEVIQQQEPPKDQVPPIEDQVPPIEDQVPPIEDQVQKPVLVAKPKAKALSVGTTKEE